MNILTIQQAIKTSKKLRQEGKTIVLAGGCFDILHIGHVKFLRAAKKQGDILFVLLESDESIKKWKGKKRPINTQKDRAFILSSIQCVDYVVTLAPLFKDAQYDSLTKQLKPAIIATTKDEPNRHHLERQAQLFGARVVDVLDRISNTSTTNLVQILSKDL